MSKETIAQAEDLAGKVGYVFVATADKSGVPHLSVSGPMKLTDNDTVSITQWFCPGTMDNLQANPNISLIVWDPARDYGFQLSGKIEKIKDIALLDGFEPKKEERIHVPQVERQLTARISKVMHFRKAPHTDTEE
jgi:uncharacterized protein